VDESEKALAAINQGASVGIILIELTVEAALSAFAKLPGGDCLARVDGKLASELRRLARDILAHPGSDASRSWTEADDEGIRAGIAQLLASARRRGDPTA